jgi:hypothetical protein
MTPEHLEQLQREWDRQISEFSCRGCRGIIMYQGRILECPMIDGLCDLCLAKREEDQAGGRDRG